MVDYSKWDKLEVSDDEGGDDSPVKKAELTDDDSCSSGSADENSDADDLDAEEEGGENEEDGSEGSWETDDEDAQNSQSKEDAKNLPLKTGPSNAAPGSGSEGSPAEVGSTTPSQKKGRPKSIPRRDHGGPYVDIDSRDDISTVPRVVREENPATWQTPLKVPGPWGIDEFEDEGEEEEDGASMKLMMAKTMRRMRAQGIYHGRDTPEVQFCKKMAERKDAELRAERKEAKLRHNQDYVLKVYMHELDPPIWRRFKVSGGIVLNTFADKVLTPIMGWVRNFHGYVFIDRKDGCLFGPKGSNAIDITCHLARSYYYYMDDKEYKLGDLLTEKGARLGWLYDLGDGWRHEVEVEDIRSESESTGTCKLLDGAGRCPPENGRGNWEYQETINILKNKRSRQYQSALDECSKAPNCKPRTFEFREFDLAERRRELKHALASPGSTQSGSKLYTHNLHPFDWEDVGPPRPKEKKGEKRVQREGADVFSPTLTETISTKADKVALSLCADCGRPEALYRCGRCRVVRYCSRECQSRHWKESHKRACETKKK